MKRMILLFALPILLALGLVDTALNLMSNGRIEMGLVRSVLGEGGEDDDDSGANNEDEDDNDDDEDEDDDDDCDDGTSGGTTGNTGSLIVKVNLGKTAAGDGTAGKIILQSEFPTPHLSSPSMLRVRGKTEEYEQLFDDGKLRQILAPQALVDIQIVDQSEYRMAFYYRDAVIGFEEGFYQFSTNHTPFTVLTFENPDGTNLHHRLDVTRKINEEVVQTFNFEWDTGDRTWTLVKGDEVQVLYTADIQVDGLSPQSSSIPGGSTLFPATSLSTNGLYVSPYGFPGLLPAGEYTVAIETPVGTYYTGPKALPGSGYGYDEDFHLFADLPAVGSTGSVARKEIKLWQDTSGVVARVEHRLHDLTFWSVGEKKLPILEIVDPEGAALTTVRTYYADPYAGKRHGKLMSRVNPDGSWEYREYDALGRKTLVLETWQDEGDLSQGVPDPDDVVATYYSYESVDPLDIPSIRHRSPRIIEKRVLGRAVEKKYYAYYLDEEEAQVEIEELAGTPESDYGDNGNQQTVTVSYEDDSFGPLKGLLKSKTWPDGRVETYVYEVGAYEPDGDQPGAFTSGTGDVVRQTITYGTIIYPDGIPFRSTQKRYVLNRLKQPLLEETFVKTASGYDLMDWTVREYDPLDRETAEYHANGLSKFTVWQSCCVAGSVTDYSGSKIVRSFDQNQRLLTETREGYTNGVYEAQADIVTTYTYDGAGNRLTETTSAGTLTQTRTNVYDLAGRLIQTVDHAGRVTERDYEDDGRRVIETRPGEGTIITETHKDGRIKSVTGTATTHRYFEYGVNEDGTSWTIAYTGPQGLNSPVWEKTTVDLLGRTVRTEMPAFGGGVQTNEFIYDTIGRLEKATMPGRPDRLYEYDELGHLTRDGYDVNDNGSLDAASMDRINERHAEYVLFGSDWWLETINSVYSGDQDDTPVAVSKQRVRQSGSSCGCAGGETETEDIFGQITLSTTSVNAEEKTVTQTLYVPDSTNPVVRVTVNGRVQSATDKSGTTVTFAYDDLGRQTEVTHPRTGTALTEYNSAGLVEYIEDTASNRTSFVYDEVGRRIQTIDALSNVVHTAYDIQGRVTNTWGATYPVAYDYDDFGRMTVMKTWRDEQGEPDITRWQYDLATGLLTNKLYADDKGTAYTYTPEGQLASRAWARGITTTYTYDPLGSLTNVAYSDSTPGASFVYDRLGRQVNVTQSGTGVPPVQVEFTYDTNTLALIAETIITGDRTNVFTRSTDTHGRPAGITLGPDYELTYSYDTLGRFSSITSSVQSVSSVVSYSYLPDSDLLQGWTQSGTGFQPVSFTRTYEENRNLITNIENMSGTNLISSFAYTNDELGRRTQRLDQSGTGFQPVQTNTFGYNLRSEVISALMGANDHEYAYDSIGNRLHAILNTETNTYTANELNQYLSVTSASSVVEPVFDDDGNMTEYGDWTFTWDGENRLIEVASNSVIMVENQYDYMSRRIMKSTATATNTYVYDGWNLLAETSATATNHYIWGLDLSQSVQGAGGVGGLLSVTKDEGQGTKHYAPAYDANGNVTEYTDTNGTIVAHYEYDPFGNISAQSGNLADGFAYRFSTKYTDDETGLVYYGYRFYNPELGRWINRDPIGELGGINLYMMGGNDPINQIDLLGLKWCWSETLAVAAAHRAYAGATLAFAGQSLIVSGLLAAWYIADNAADIACLAVPPARAVYNTCRGNKPHECCLTEYAVYTGLKDSCDRLKQIADDLMEQYSDASDLLTALGSVVADAAREIARADRALHDCLFGP